MFRILNMFGAYILCVLFPVFLSLCLRRRGRISSQIAQRTSLYVSTVAAREASVAAGDGAEVDPDTDVPPGGRLVRVPIDELQQTESK